ncbi:MAG: radical SAM family heme chaperone HemW [Phycisphaerales bacterium]
MIERFPKSVYVHIPFCKSKCLYCGFYSKPPGQFDIQKLLDSEIEELTNSNFSKPIKTLYIGGGSPASIGCAALCGFLSEVQKITGKAEEFTIEINPADVDENFLRKLFETGVNRISIGIQSFHDDELVFLGRRYKTKQALETIGICKQIGFKNISIDLIFAVPGSNLEKWKQNLETAIKTDVQHISAYSLTYETDTPLEKIRAAGKVNVVSEEEDRQMYEMTIDVLAGAGIEQYEISNFAKPGFECKHNITYWQNDYYIGIGPAACGYIEGLRYENINDINKYIEQKDKKAEKTVISEIEKACQTAVLGLRLVKGIDLNEYQQKTGYDIFKIFKNSMEKNLKANLLQIKDNRLSLTRSALPIADTVLSDFAETD